MEYGYTQLEGAMGLMPAKLGPNDKTPAYIMRKSKFWKIFGVAALTVLGFTILYIATNQDLARAKDGLVLEAQEKMRTEHALNAKLAALELELEEELLQEGRQGVLANWYRDRLVDAEVNHKEEVAKSLKNLAKDVGLTAEQHQALLFMFGEEVEKYSETANRLAHKITHHLEKEGKAAQQRLTSLHEEFDKLVEHDQIQKQNYLESGPEGAAISENGVVEGQKFVDVEHEKMYKESLAQDSKIAQAIENFFNQAGFYKQKVYKPVPFSSSDKIFQQLSSLYVSAVDLSHIDNDQLFHEALNDLRVKLGRLQPQLTTAGVAAFDPKKHTEMGYIRDLMIRSVWPDAEQEINVLHNEWTKNKDKPLQILSKIQHSIYNGNVPEEFLFNDLTPIFEMPSDTGNQDFKIPENEDFIQLELNKMKAKEEEKEGSKDE